MNGIAKPITTSKYTSLSMPSWNDTRTKYCVQVEVFSPDAPTFVTYHRNKVYGSACLSINF